MLQHICSSRSMKMKNKVPFAFCKRIAILHHDTRNTDTFEDGTVRKFGITRRPKEELYELANNPYEVVNIADNPQYKVVLDDLRSHLRNWQEATDDPWIVKYRYE